MDASPGEDRPGTADIDPDSSLRMQIAVADAAFIADGIALGLLLKWAEQAEPPDDETPRARARGTPSGDMQALADH
jgi:hypothetical protein